MANPLRGEVELQAGDQTLTLRLSINAIVELEDRLGLGINQIAAKLSDSGNMRIGDWRAVLWAALRDNHGGVTIEQAGELLAAAGVQTAVAALGKAMQLAFPEASEGERPSQTAKPEAGKAS